MAISPYQNKQQSEWKSITEELITNYPLSTDEILEISLIAWEKLWGTEVGGTIKLVEVDLPATVIGYFFQKLFSYELSKRYPNEWKGEKEKSDKDLVNIKNPTFSTEMKASGQLGYKIFGNRSYNQQGFNEETTGKDKSGFYITINFYSQTLTLISIGWIDQNDWNSQDSETGQAATLKPEVYTHKLVQINGKYQLKSPISLLNGIGKVSCEKLYKENIFTFEDIINYKGNDKVVINIYNKNKSLLETIKECSLSVTL
ncbi:ScaI family restriction endonuclease [Sulfurimonas sp.]|jgi:hypothetical protein|uniref:ScaI family restriction endonuclease n=1 Tax=Sulfurimonas sp. TaxID=2022749 RepID=UPI0025E84946|nr:ScaI family restriction endonuclease [Sulfurimonas sp.]MCK9473982.1 ScaI family restriction endonuclease [Sulfurimonas sp.]